jgi:hypothetical protein
VPGFAAVDVSVKNLPQIGILVQVVVSEELAEFGFFDGVWKVGSEVVVCVAILPQGSHGVTLAALP